MKRKFLSSLVMLVLIIAGAFSPILGFFGTKEFVPKAYAQTSPYLGPGGDPNATGAGEEQDPTIKDDVDAQKAAELDCGANPVCRTVKSYITLVLAPSYSIAAISGFFLDYVLLGTITSGSYSENSGMGTIAVIGWKLIRDFTNLLFIFALFAVAFNLILNVNTSGGTGASNGFGLDPKRTIARILLMALLVNFSFFLSRSIIDISNQVGYVFFNKISITGGTNYVDSNSDNNSGLIGGVYDALGIKSVSLAVLANADPQSLVLNSVADSGGDSIKIAGFTAWGSYDWKTYIAMLQVSLISSLFNFFLAFIFISIGVVLLGRTIGLIFGIILSPIAFVSFAIPSLENQPHIGFSNWFSEFTKLAVTAPVLLFFLYLIVTFLKTPFISSDQAGFLATASFIVIKLSAVGGLLMMARKVTKELAGRAGQIASKIAVGVATTVAVVGATAATGGAAAVGAMGRRYAVNKGRELAANGISRATGQDVEAIQQRMKGLKNFNSKMFTKEIGGMIRKNAPKSIQSIDSGIQTGMKAGRQFTTRDAQGRNVYERAAAMAAGAEQRKKDKELRTEKVRQLDYKTEKLQKEFKNPNLDDEGRKVIRDQVEQIKKEKWAIENHGNQNVTPINQVAGQAPESKPAEEAPIQKNEVKTDTQNTTNNVTTVTEEKTGTATFDQIKSVVEDIEKDLRAIEEEAKKPEVIANKNRTDELQARYQNLEQERKDASSGKILPVRLKSITLTPLGGPVRKTFGDDLGKRETYTPNKQEKILTKAIARDIERKEYVGPSPADIQKSKVSKLLSGITGNPSVSNNNNTSSGVSQNIIESQEPGSPTPSENPT